jgi:ATP-binding cassette subfamily F protein 3
MQRAYPDEREQQLLDYLGQYAFHGDMVRQACASLSGGEKSRLVLAILMRDELNLLILDEPTNHLDLQAREALTLALQDFEGALILVSHDRHLLETSCDQYRLVANGKVSVFDGTIEDYAASVLTSPEKNTTSSTGSTSRKQQRQRAALRRQNLAPLQKVVKQLERQMDDAQHRLQQLEAQLASTDIYEDHAKEQLKQVLQEQAESQHHLTALETDYFEALEKLEQAEQALDDA